MKRRDFNTRRGVRQPETFAKPVTHGASATSRCRSIVVSGCLCAFISRQPENAKQCGDKWLAHQNMACKPWWANELPTLRLNAGAMVRQPETLARAPTACRQAVRWLKIRRQPEMKIPFQAAFAHSHQGSLKTTNPFSGCLTPSPHQSKVLSLPLKSSILR